MKAVSIIAKQQGSLASLADATPLASASSSKGKKKEKPGKFLL
jgi:hypothetical protein